jgi:carbon-monoxide dehydrogenase large subunit
VSDPRAQARPDPTRPAIGQPLARVEDERFLTGAARFVDDWVLPDLLHAVVVRSPHASGRLRSLETSQARAMPGVVAVYAWADIAACARTIPVRLAPLPGFDRFLQAPLAQDCVRYVGEPVAMVVATSRALAEDAAERVEVDIDPGPVVASLADALAARASVHEAGTDNVASRYTVSRGDPASAFAAAAYRRRETFRCHRQTALPLETRGLVARHDPVAGRLQVWGASKVTFFNRRWLAAALDMPESSVELIELDVGGSFGVRGELYPEDFLVPFAARQLGRPVKWIEDRREHLIATNHSREIECELEIACTAQGEVLGLRGRVLGDLGAYVRTNGGVVPAKAAQFLPGPYRIPNCEFEVVALLTHRTPVGTYRGPGRYEANFFRERLLDLAARDLGIDPVELRRRNLIGPDEMPFDCGVLCPYEPATQYDTGDYPMALERALDAVGGGRALPAPGRDERGRLTAFGVACFVESSGAGPAENARLRVLPDGRIEVGTGCSTMGQGHETVLAQIASDAMGLPVDRFVVHHGSTTLVEHGYGTYHSRAVVVGGSAVDLAARKLVARCAALLAQRSGLEPSMVDCREGRFMHRTGGAVLGTFAQLGAEAAAGDAEAIAATQVEDRFEVRKRTYTYGTHVAEVAVDPETAEVEVLRHLAVEDIGRAVNPLLVHGQAIGAAVQGLSAAFLDELVYDAAGQLLTGTLADYRVATADGFPRVEAITLEEHRSPHNPLGVKGAGEGGIVATAAAVANAVATALAPLGVTLTELPLSPERLARALRAARASPPPPA